MTNSSTVCATFTCGHMRIDHAHGGHGGCVNPSCECDRFTEPPAPAPTQAPACQFCEHQESSHIHLDVPDLLAPGGSSRRYGGCRIPGCPCEQYAAAPAVPAWVTLDELRPGALFETEAGNTGFKTEHRDSEGTPICYTGDTGERFVTVYKTLRVRERTTAAPAPAPTDDRPVVRAQTAANLLWAVIKRAVNTEGRDAPLLKLRVAALEGWILENHPSVRASQDVVCTRCGQRYDAHISIGDGYVLGCDGYVYKL